MNKDLKLKEQRIKNIRLKDMNREIKFKVWDNEKKRMSQPFYLGAFAIKWNDGDIEMPVLFATVKDGRFTYLQFTGFKDINGVEVYDGDKFNGEEHQEYYVVEWDDREAKFNLAYYGFPITIGEGGQEVEANEVSNIDDGEMSYVTRMAIIGNIHEPL